MTDEVEVEVDKEIGELAYTAYIDARARRDFAQIEMDTHKKAIIEALDDATHAVVNGVRVLHLRRYNSHRMDTTRLREEYPGIADLYTRAIPHTRLELVK